MKMIFMVVRWDGEKYVILHYSHDFTDTERMHAYWKEKFPDAQLLVDVKVLEVYEGMLKIQEYKRKLHAQNTSS